MGFLNWLDTVLNPPGITKKNRRTIFKTISDVADTVVSDVNLTLRDFFPFTAAADRLFEHGSARKLPQFSFETDDVYRERLATGSFFLERTGEKGLFIEIMDKIVPGRWKFVEYPEVGFRIGYSLIGKGRIGGDSRLIIYVRNLTAEEYDKIYEFLDWFLGVDIDIVVINWEYVPYDPVTLAELRTKGGASWLIDQLDDIADVSVEIMPDNALKIGSFKIGSNRIWDDSEIVFILVKAEYHAQISLRLDVVLDPGVSRQIIDL